MSCKAGICIFVFLAALFGLNFLFRGWAFLINIILYVVFLAHFTKLRFAEPANEPAELQGTQHERQVA